MITNRCKGPNVPSHPDNTAGGSTHTGERNSFDAADVIQEALFFANNETSKTRNAPSEPIPEGEGGHGGQKSSDIAMEEELRVSEQNKKDGVHEVDPHDEPGDDGVALKNADPLPDIDHDAPLVNRKSKRARVAPKNLVGDYQCDKKFLTRAWKSFVNATCTTTSIDYAAKVVVLSERLASSFVIDFGSLKLESSELLAIVERCITPDVLQAEVERTAVMIYEENVASL
ncbi:hypothetical protein Bca52824_001349 [Brassica carinata]|uniref:Uncharacterized protein n=1 Tax=Brassica carinata TaxID=52824 RepID=A0A8X7WI57_BRACI|nr:hypothetical protein Bca52824_001349 [Brassica carinata]